MGVENCGKVQNIQNNQKNIEIPLNAPFTTAFLCLSGGKITKYSPNFFTLFRPSDEFATEFSTNILKIRKNFKSFPHIVIASSKAHNMCYCQELLKTHNTALRAHKSASFRQPLTQDGKSHILKIGRTAFAAPKFLER